MYYQENLFESEESYIHTLRMSPKIKSIKLHENLGLLYVKRQSWNDAQIVFYKCAQKYPTANAWRYLGLSYLKLGKPIEAEESLTQSIIMDNLNSDAWSFISLLCLLGNQRKIQALQCLKEVFKLKIRNTGILDEVGEILMKFNEFKVASECFTKALSVADKNGEIWTKLGDCFLNIEGEKSKSIEFYKNALKYVEGENQKAQLKLALHDLLISEGQAEEAKIYSLK